MTNQTKWTTLIDEKVSTRIKLAGLWISVMLCYIEGDFASFFPPGGYTAQSIAGKMGPFEVSQLTLLSGSVFMVIPCLMVFLSLIMYPRINRRVNIIIAFFYTVVNAISFLTSHWAYFIFFGIIESALTILIVLYAWKWPKAEIAVQ